jgi:hypothetical protein
MADEFERFGNRSIITGMKPLRWMFAMLFCLRMNAAPVPEANYDESKIGTITLPDLLTMANGAKAATAEDWKAKRRPEILELYKREMFGRSPGRPPGLKFEVKSTKTNALDGLATRREILVSVPAQPKWPGMMVLVYTPNKASKPAPAFAGLSFGGNYTVTTEPDVAMTTRWVPNARGVIADNRANEASRGMEASRWPIRMILERGFALATAYYGDLEPDYNQGYKESVRSLFGDYTENPDQAPEGWSAIGAWAWGLSRMMDLLETLPEIDARKVAVIGHSRLGKTSLWAGASDERFAMVISNNSGEGGAAISRRNIGETVHRINNSFPHWFNGNYKKYNQNVNALPFDSHMLVALAAPRPVYIASAVEDTWADPKGEFLAGVYADPAYRLFGREGISDTTQPPVNHPVGNFIGYHIRTGKHDVTDYDWDQYLQFADRHLRGAAVKN